MKKKFLLGCISLVCLFACTFAFVACGDPDDTPAPPPAPFTVTFVTDGGTPIDPIVSTTSNTLERLLNGKTTEKAGKVFVGWYSDAACGESAEVSPSAVISADTTLYAAWRDYTDYELLENAVTNTRAQAIVAHDAGAVRFNTSTSGYGTVDVTLALHEGVITAGARASRYYKDGMFYYSSGGEHIKLEQNDSETVTEFLYLNVLGTVDYKQHGFFSTFAPLSMYRLADTSLCDFSRDGDMFTVTFKGSQSGVKHNWAEEGDPWVYFGEAGRIFRFTVSQNRVVKAEQIQTAQAYRTIEFFFEDDADIPVVETPQDENDYVQMWQVMANGRNMLCTELNKAELDRQVFGSDYEQITKDQTYYTDEGMQHPVPFDAGGIAPLNAHIVLYHATVSADDLVVNGYTLTPQASTLQLVGTSTENGVKTTTYVRRDASTAGTVEIKIEATPWSAREKDFTVEPVDAQSDEEIVVHEYIGSKSVSVPKSIAREYTLKITAVKGGYTEYIVIRPMA